MRTAVPILTVLLLVTAVTADDEPKKLAPNELPGSFIPHNVTGKYGERLLDWRIKDKEGKERKIETELGGQYHSLVCDNALNPVAMVFVRDPELGGDEMVKLLQALEGAVRKHQRSLLGSFVVFVNDSLTDVVTQDEERDRLAKRVRELDTKAGLKGGRYVVPTSDPLESKEVAFLGRHVALALEGRDKLKAFPIDDKAAVTLVLYRNLLVNKTITIPTRDDIEKQLPAILAAIDEMVGTEKKPAGK